MSTLQDLFVVNPFSAGALPELRWGRLRRSPDSLVDWGEGYYSLFPFPRHLRRLELGAYGASVLRPPTTPIPGYASVLLRIHIIYTDASLAYDKNVRCQSVVVSQLASCRLPQ